MKKTVNKNWGETKFHKTTFARILLDDDGNQKLKMAAEIQHASEVKKYPAKKT